MEIVTITDDEVEIFATSEKTSSEFLNNCKAHLVDKKSLLKELVFDIPTSQFNSLTDIVDNYDNIINIPITILSDVSSSYGNEHYPDYFPIQFIDLLDELDELMENDEKLPKYVLFLY